MIEFSMKKKVGLSTIVWVPISDQPKLPLTVRHVLQNVIILNCNDLWTLALV
jgi:hypothetical protein